MAYPVKKQKFLRATRAIFVSVKVFKVPTIVKIANFGALRALYHNFFGFVAHIVEKQGNRRPQLTGYTWLWKYPSGASSLNVRDRISFLRGTETAQKIVFKSSLETFQIVA